MHDNIWGKIYFHPVDYQPALQEDLAKLWIRNFTWIEGSVHVEYLGILPTSKSGTLHEKITGSVGGLKIFWHGSNTLPRFYQNQLPCHPPPTHPQPTPVISLKGILPTSDSDISLGVDGGVRVGDGPGEIPNLGMSNSIPCWSSVHFAARYFFLFFKAKAGKRITSKMIASKLTST